MQIETESFRFKLANSKRIEIVTGDKAAAEFLGIPCQKIGYNYDEEMKAEEIKKEKIRRAMFGWPVVRHG